MNCIELGIRPVEPLFRLSGAGNPRAAEQADGFIMGIVIKRPGDAPEVQLQCFATPDVHVINSQLLAIPTTALTLQ